MIKQKKQANHWGYIEGYYWRLMTWDERTMLVEHLGRVGADSYLYAPKEDPLHRKDWRIPYGKKWLSHWSKFTAKAAGVGVKAIPGLAPGLSFDYLLEQDYKLLLEKFQVFKAGGNGLLALLMDDIPPVLPSKCRGVFRSLGQAHGHLLSRLLSDLNSSGHRCRMWFCPTVYTDQFATDKKGKAGKPTEDEYLLDLAATMPKEVTVMWTGPNIISERLTSSNILPVAKLFQANLVIWDNLYANDYCPNKLFLGPYRGRSHGLWKWTRGVLLNPTGLPVTDMFLLSLLAAFKSGLGSEAAWRQSLEAFAVPAAFKKAARFLDSPFFKPDKSDFKPERIAALRKALHPLIWDWASPLHREWASALFMLDADLKACLQGKEAPDAAWVRKRYSPIVAKLLLDR